MAGAVVDLPDWLRGAQPRLPLPAHADRRTGPDLYVAQEVRDNRFQIAGGKPGLKVSWQVTGIRQDAWAEANRMAVEEDKPVEEQGTYLHPEVYDQPENKSLGYKEAQERAIKVPQEDG